MALNAFRVMYNVPDKFVNTFLNALYNSGTVTVLGSGATASNTTLNRG